MATSFALIPSWKHTSAIPMTSVRWLSCRLIDVVLSSFLFLLILCFCRHVSEQKAANQLSLLDFLLRTGVQWTTSNPTWNATWTLLGVPEGMALNIFVKDKNKMIVDTLLGTCVLVLAGSQLEGIREHTLKVCKPSERMQGEIYIQVCRQPTIERI